MEQNLWWVVGLSSLTVSAATWAVCRWWFGRQLAVASDRMAKLDKARAFSSQQVMQARKQIEKLQRDMAGLQHRPVYQSSAPSLAAQVEAVLRTVDQIPARTGMPASGFADTQAFETT